MSKPLVSCLLGCGESVNPPKFNTQEVQGALSSRLKGDPGPVKCMPCSIVVAGIFASCSVRYVHHSETSVIFCIYSFVAFFFLSNCIRNLLYVNNNNNNTEFL